MSLARVAKHAGVSTATVCRVLRQSRPVKPETARQVLAAVRKTGYVPPPPSGAIHRRINERRAHGSLARIAVITLGGSHREWMAVPAIASFIASLSAAGREMKTEVMLDEMPDVSVPSRLIREGDINGAILLVHSALARMPEGIRALRRLAGRLPVVWAMGAPIGPQVVDHVCPNHLGIGHLAGDYLLSKGCRNCAVVARMPQWALIRERVTGFAGCLYDAGTAFRSYIVSNDSRDADVFPGRARVIPSLEDVAMALASADPRPDGLFVPTDAQIAELHPRLIQAGFTPGVDLHLVSCDHDRIALSLIHPLPATIDLNTQEIAELSIRRLQMRMQALDETLVTWQVSPKLIEPEPTRTERITPCNDSRHEHWGAPLSSPCRASSP